MVESTGLRMASFHGNFFVSSSDLLTMPSIPEDQSYSIEVEYDDDMKGSHVVLQTASLHTTSEGERRIRVITLALPTTSNISQVYASADQIAIATFLASKAVECHKLEDARDAVTNKLVEILTAYKASVTAGGVSAQLSVPENLKMLPLLCLGLTKHVSCFTVRRIPRIYRSCTLVNSRSGCVIVLKFHPTCVSTCRRC
jgi:protein transport protein SEC24